MDHNDRRPRQNLSGYAGQQGTLLQPQAQYPVVSASAPDRFRQAPLAAQQPPTSAPSGSRYAYEPASQFAGSSIQPSYGAQEYAVEQQQPQQRASQYGQYGQSVYGVAGAQAPAAGQSQYESVQQPYEASRDPAIQALGTSFGVAQGQAYYGVQEGPTSAPASAIAPQNVPSQYSSLGYPVTQPPVAREHQAYSAAGMTDPHQAAAQGGYAHAQAGFSGEQHGENEYDNFYNTYQQELKKTFEHTRDGRLREAGDQLFRLSDWLLQWAETLGEYLSSRHHERAAELTIGLVRDEESQYEDRLRLWEQFNNCWLTTLQRQKEMTQEMIKRSQRPQPPQSLIEADFLEKMGTQLIKNCDTMEKHGLVDYQMGVWEEEIIASV